MTDELYLAIWGQSLEYVKKHAFEASNINAKNKRSETALMSAVNRGEASIVNLLLTVPGIKLEIKNKHQQTALFMAAKTGSIEMCEILLKAGAKVNSRNYSGANVILAAVQNPACFSFLLKHNPDMHCRNELKMSCLTYLYKAKNIVLIEELVSHSKVSSDIDNFHQQRIDVYKYYLKNKTSFTGNEEFNQQVEKVINRVKLKLDLQNDLNLKYTKTSKTKI